MKADPTKRPSEFFPTYCGLRRLQPLKRLHHQNRNQRQRVDRQRTHEPRSPAVVDVGEVRGRPSDERDVAHDHAHHQHHGRVDERRQKAQQAATQHPGEEAGIASDRDPERHNTGCVQQVPIALATPRAHVTEHVTSNAPKRTNEVKNIPISAQIVKQPRY